MAEGFSRQWCPGEEECPTAKSSVNPDRTCRECPRNLSKTKASEIEGSEAVMSWLRHIFWLYSLRQAGATFLLNELSLQEWEGLITLEGVRAEIEREQYEKQEMKKKVRAAQAKH